MKGTTMKLTATLATLAVAAIPLAVAAPAQAGDNKVGICHATGAEKNPYVSLLVAADGTVNGHAGTDHQGGADIIPAFSYVEGGVRYYFAGQNLDKLSILENGCEVPKDPAEPVTAGPIAPVYRPATCELPDQPYGSITVPDNPGLGVNAVSDPYLNADNTVYSVDYTLSADTEEYDFSWPEGFTGRYDFTVVPLTADPRYVVDSVTGVGACELPEMGAGTILAYGAAGLGVLGLGAGLMAASRRRES